MTRFASPSFQTLVDDYAAKGIAFEQAKRLHGSKHMTSIRAEYESLYACRKIFERVWQHTIRTNVAESENAGIRQSEFLGGACELIGRAIQRQNADVSMRQALVKNFEDDFKLSRRLCLVGDLFWYSPPLPRLEVN